jgi:hypothetical protein
VRSPPQLPREGRLDLSRVVVDHQVRNVAVRFVGEPGALEAQRQSEQAQEVVGQFLEGSVVLLERGPEGGELLWPGVGGEVSLGPGTEARAKRLPGVVEAPHRVHLGQVRRAGLPPALGQGRLAQGGGSHGALR